VHFKLRLGSLNGCFRDQELVRVRVGYVRDDSPLNLRSGLFKNQGAYKAKGWVR